MDKASALIFKKILFSSALLLKCFALGGFACLLAVEFPGGSYINVIIPDQCPPAG